MKTPNRSARERILEEAEHLIHVHGYRGTSLEEIARRCRMTKANLFHHFRSKEDLGLAVLDYKIACYRRCLDAAFGQARGAEEAIAELFAQTARFHRGNGCRAGCFIGNIALEMSDINPRFRERAAAFFEDWVSRVAAALENGGQTAGRAARAAAETILSLYEGATMLARASRDPAVLDRAKESALQILRSIPEKKEVSVHGT